MVGVIGIAGSVGSIIGAAIAVWQAHRAVKAASKAESLRDEIVKRTSSGELGELESLLSLALRRMAAYSPGRTAKSLSGRNSNDDADAVSDFKTKLMQISSIVDDEFNNACQQLFNALNTELIAFGNASNDTIRLRHGNAIHSLLVTFSNHLHTARTSKQFAPVP